MEINIEKTEYTEQSPKLQGEINLQENYINPKISCNYPDIRLKLQEIIENFIAPKDINLSDKINEKFLELDFGSEFDINADKIGVSDAIFFVNLLNQQNLISYTVEDSGLSLSDFEGKKINATTSLLNMLKTSLDTKKPIRLDFDNDVTVVLKLDKEGKIQAHFIPGTSEVENYLKNNIQSLKQIFDDEEIAYSYLGYSKNKNNEQNKKRSNK